MSLQPGLALLRHQRRLAARWASRLGRHDAEDLASEAIARGLARPSPDGRAEPWIESIFRNLIADAGRRLVRRGAPTEDASGAAIDAWPPMAPSATPEEALLARERARAIGAALPAIPTELREALVARFYQERDYDQMAAASGISVTTARTRVWRGLARLRRSLDGLRATFPLALRLKGGGAAAFASALVPAAVVSLLAIVPASGRDGSTVSVADAVALPARERPPRISAPPPVYPPPDETASSSGTPVRGSRAEPSPRAPGGAPRPAPTTPRGAPVPPAAGEGDTPDQRPVAVKRYDFDADEVDGELQTPSFLFVPGNAVEARLGSLIEIPTSLEPSMTKMIEDL